MPRYQVIWVHSVRGTHVHHFDTLDDALFYWRIQCEFWPETSPSVVDLEAPVRVPQPSRN